LLVDDVAMFLDIQKSFLRLSSAKIMTARDGVEALQSVRENRPDLVIMDLHMPKMNGAECCSAIKADPLCRKTPVLLITAACKEEDRRLCVGSGCDDFITKPLDRAMYLEKARRFVPGIERREKRMPVKAPAKFRMFGVTLSGTVLDVSTRGVYIAADYPVEPKSVIDISFILPDGWSTPVEVTGRVSWVNTAGKRTKANLPAGFGVEFTAVGKEAADAIRRMVADA
jgi:CheY-like chemotaxis protein